MVLNEAQNQRKDCLQCWRAREVKASYQWLIWQSQWESRRMKKAENLTWSSLKLSNPRLRGGARASPNYARNVYISISGAPLHKCRVAVSKGIFLNIHDVWGYVSCWRIIAEEGDSPWRCVFSSHSLFLHSRGLLCSAPELVRSLQQTSTGGREKMIKALLGSLLWTLHGSLLCNPGEDVLNNSIVSTSAPLYF